MTLTEQQHTHFLALCQHGRLSPAERHLLLHDMLRYGNRADAADALQITRKTVSTYRRRICDKLHLTTWGAVRHLCLSVILTGVIPARREMWNTYADDGS